MRLASSLLLPTSQMLMISSLLITFSLTIFINPVATAFVTSPFHHLGTINHSHLFRHVPISLYSSSSSSPDYSNRPAVKTNNDESGYCNKNESEEKKNSQTNRRKFITSSLATAPFAMSLLSVRPSFADIEGVSTVPQFDPNPKKELEGKTGDVTVYKTKSGLKYIELSPPLSTVGATTSTLKTPRYGNLVSFSYIAYIKLPPSSSKLQEYNRDPTYITKHGNGRLIPGLDEGLHTMTIGSKRRLIIPPKLGYVGSGVLGPLPVTPWTRFRLSRLLEQMVEAKGGNIIMDVELKNIIVDEADQGYYEDESVSPQEFEELGTKIRTNYIQAKKDGKAGPNTKDLIGSADFSALGSGGMGNLGF